MKYFLFALFVLFANNTHAQGWIKKHDLDTLGFSDAMGDTANGKLYIGGGDNDSVALANIWEYNPVYNSWKQKSHLPTINGFTGEREDGFCVTVNNRLYFGLGASYYNHDSACEYYLVEYDPGADTFSRKADFIGPARFFAVAFNLNNKIYAGLGYKFGSTGSHFMKDFYEYDPATDTWARKADFPAPGRWGSASFVINGKAYVTNGIGPTYVGDPVYDSTYEYDPTTDTWTVKSMGPVSGVGLYAAFSIDTLGYYLTGKKFWSYSPVANRWSSLPDFPGSNRSTTVSFVLNHYAYIATGYYGYLLNDLWQYRPDCPANIINELSLSTLHNTFCSSAVIDSINADSIAYATTTYQWLMSNDSISFTPIAGSDSIRLRKRTFTATTYLKRIVTLTAGCIDTSVAIGIHVALHKKPLIDSLTNTHLCVGDTAVLACISSLQKFWYLNDTLLIDTARIFRVPYTGTYRVITTQPYGCTDTSASIKIVYEPRPVPIVHQVGSSLTTGKYLLYQWYNTSMSPVPGATAQSFIPSDSGSYRVKVIDSTGCAGFSAYFKYMPTGILNVLPSDDSLRLFPNPANKQITLTSLKPGEDVTIINELGQLLINYQVKSPEQSFDISPLPPGTYFIRITGAANTLLKRFIKL